ncbi:MAG TPA: hypothetical protein VGM22_16125 [Methylomirabilota bacterium]|jgi:hypothetical protein
MDSSAERNPGHEDIEPQTEGKQIVPPQHDADIEMDETQISLDEDDLELDEDVTEEEAERADGA